MSEVAKAYIQLIPSAQGIKGVIEKELGGEAKSAGVNIGNVFSSAVGEGASGLSSKLQGLGVDLTDVTEKLGISSEAMSGLSAAFTSGAAAAAAYAVPIIAIVSELVKLSNEASKFGDSVATLAIKYNTSTAAIQKFQYMAELTDTSVETVTGSITKLTRSMSGAQDGTGAAAEAFAKLGINVTNGNGSLRSANAVFAEAIDALGRVGNATERDALAMEIFGKSAAELNPLIAQGSERIRELANEAENSGYVLSDKMIAILAEGDDATQRLSNSMDGFKNTLGALVTPAVTVFKDVLSEALENVTVGIQKLTGMRDAASETAGAIDGITEAVDGMNEAITGIRDSTPEDFLPAEQQAYHRYVQEALKYSKETGQQVTIWRPDVALNTAGYYAGNYNNGGQINLSINVDGQEFARATYDSRRAEDNRVGNHAIR